MHSLPAEPVHKRAANSPPRLLSAACLTLPIVLLAAFLRTHQIAHKSLWLDEAFSVWMSEQPLPDLFTWTVRIDQHPPLYYLVLRAWAQLGGSPPSPAARAFWVRMPSAFLGTLSVAVIYALGRRLAGPTAGLLAALLLAISPFHVWFGQEARMYTLFTLNASLAMLGLVRLITWPPLSPLRGLYGRGLERGLAWALYIFFTAATLWTHNTGLFFWAATNLFVLGGATLSTQRGIRQETGFSGKNPISRALKDWLLAQLAILLLWSPWLPPFLQQAAGVDREFWLSAPTWATIGETLSSFTSAFLPPRTAWRTLLWLACGVLLGAGIYALQIKPVVLSLLATLFVTPFVGELLVSLRRPIFYTRTLIWATLPLYLLFAIGAAAGAATVRKRRASGALVWIALALLLAANARSIHTYYADYQKEAWDEAAQYVAKGSQPGDLILFNASWVQLPFDFYFQTPVVVQKRGLPVDLFDRGILEPKMTEEDLPRLEALLQGQTRVWLVYSHDWYTDPQHLIPTALDREGRLLETRHLNGIEIHLYQLSRP